MAKRTIQAGNPGYFVGLEHDHLSIRGARLAADGRGGFAIDGLEEISGTFSEEAELADGMRTLKERLGVVSRDTLVTCLAGKQIFASQISFRRLPMEEMENALRLELRKNLHFEIAGANLDFQILTEGEAKGEPIQVLVALAANALLTRQLRCLERAGLKPSAVDVLPLAVANALWAFRSKEENPRPMIALHIGAQLTTIVIDGEKSPFFNRNVPFNAEEVLGTDGHPDREKRLQSLADEISRSLAYYEKSAFVGGFREVLLLGEYLESGHIDESFLKRTGLSVRPIDLRGTMGFARETPKGKFDLALALALRGET